MKKIFTLFAAALVGFCAFAQDPCPSKLAFEPIAEEQDANNVQLELSLMYNNSDNLNGFNLEATKTGGEWIMMDEILEAYFTAEGYEANILKAWGKPEATCVANLSKMCDVMSNVKPNGNLVMIEILKTNACRFFPRINEGEDAPLPVGKFAIDLSACEDGEYTINIDATAETGSFSYTGGPEGTRAWTTDEAIWTKLGKTGNKVKVNATAISTITTDQPVDNRIFDLQGRQLQSVPEHGIYIQNGKKYVK